VNNAVDNSAIAGLRTNRDECSECYYGWFFFELF